MNNSKFLKPPLSEIEKEEKAEKFLNFLPTKEIKEVEVVEKANTRRFKKEDIKAFALRFPKSIAEDLSEISAITGLSVNSVCIELLRPATKAKLKELKD